MLVSLYVHLGGGILGPCWVLMGQNHRIECWEWWCLHLATYKACSSLTTTATPFCALLVLCVMGETFSVSDLKSTRLSSVTFRLVSLLHLFCVKILFNMAEGSYTQHKEVAFHKDLGMLHGQVLYISNRTCKYPHECMEADLKSTGFETISFVNGAFFNHLLKTCMLPRQHRCYLHMRVFVTTGSMYVNFTNQGSILVVVFNCVNRYLFDPDVLGCLAVMEHLWLLGTPCWAF